MPFEEALLKRGVDDCNILDLWQRDIRYLRPLDSLDDRFRNRPGNVGETHFSAGVKERESFVVESE